MTQTLTLRCADLAVEIAPALGGSIVAFTRGGDAILRETPPTALAERKPTLAASYPMIPYCNRIAQGRFAFGGERFQLARNFGESPHSIHGNAWQREWAVAQTGPTEARLVLDHNPARDGAHEWPFAYAAEQHFALTPDSFSVKLVLENRDARSMPAGFGLHPYFDKNGAALRFQATDVWRSDASMLPTERTPVPPGWDCSIFRAVSDVAAVDHCFAGWDGTADIAYPGKNLAIRIEADPVFGKVIFFRLDEKPFFAVEPVSHSVDAVNRLDETSDHGLRVLAPGESMEGLVRFFIAAVP